MVGVGQQGTGTAGCAYNANDGVETFPCVPFGPSDFNDKYCHGDIQGSDYTCCADNVSNHFKRVRFSHRNRNQNIESIHPHIVGINCAIFSNNFSL